MVILDCNFGPEPSNDIIAKLDKLNDEWEKSGSVDQRHLNNFVDWANYSIGGTYTWGGYPVNYCDSTKENPHSLNTSNNAEWQTDQITNVLWTGDKTTSISHLIDSSQYDNVADIAPQIYSNENKINGKMGGGASGSMVIDYHKNVVGIYWGGSIPTGYFYPYFDIFNDYNFSYGGTKDIFLTPYMFS
jgi:hypothetical protein